MLPGPLGCHYCASTDPRKSFQLDRWPELGLPGHRPLFPGTGESSSGSSLSCVTQALNFLILFVKWQ